MKTYSYLRVSTQHQQSFRQEYVLEQQGIKVDKAFVDKISGTIADRPKLNELKLTVKEGDIIYCESISRLGRSLRDTIDICEYFVNKGVTVRILKEGIDSDASTYKLLLGIFGAIAELERDTILERTVQRIDQLKKIKSETGEIQTKSGVWFGRETTTKETILRDYPKFEDYLSMVDKGIINKIEMARMLGVGKTTLYKYINIYNEDKK